MRAFFFLYLFRGYFVFGSGRVGMGGNFLGLIWFCYKFLKMLFFFVGDGFWINFEFFWYLFFN